MAHFSLTDLSKPIRRSDRFSEMMRKRERRLRATRPQRSSPCIQAHCITYVHAPFHLRALYALDPTQQQQHNLLPSSSSLSTASRRGCRPTCW